MKNSKSVSVNKQTFIYRQYKGKYWFDGIRYIGNIESKLTQLFPKVEEELNLYYSAESDEDLWDKICDAINNLENNLIEEEMW